MMSECCWFLFVKYKTPRSCVIPQNRRLLPAACSPSGGNSKVVICTKASTPPPPPPPTTRTHTHQIPRHRLATAWCWRLKLASGSQGPSIDAHIRYTRLQLSSAVYCRARAAVRLPDLLLWVFRGEGRSKAKATAKRRRDGLYVYYAAFVLWSVWVCGCAHVCVCVWGSVCVCVVQWCSQTPKHVLLKLYECAHCLLFYNLLWGNVTMEMLLMWIFIYEICMPSFF